MNAKYAARVGGEWSGPMKKGYFLAQAGVGASQKITVDHWESISVDSFTLTVFRDTSVLFIFKNVGNVFHKDLVILLKGIVPGDRILIFDIYAMDLSREKKLLLQPLEYLIE
jgi:hypothetical protein